MAAVLKGRTVYVDRRGVGYVSDRIGTIEAGKDADIVVYDGSPLEIFSKAVYTLINGQVVYKSNA